MQMYIFGWIGRLQKDTSDLQLINESRWPAYSQWSSVEIFWDTFQKLVNILLCSSQPRNSTGIHVRLRPVNELEYLATLRQTILPYRYLDGKSLLNNSRFPRRGCELPKVLSKLEVWRRTHFIICAGRSTARSQVRARWVGNADQSLSVDDSESVLCVFARAPSMTRMLRLVQAS